MKRLLYTLACGILLATLPACSDENPEMPPPVLREDLSLDKTSVSLDGGESCKLVATLASKDASAQITWTSSDENIAEVDQEGNVKAVGSGVATISAKADLQKDATCTIDVISDIYIAGVDGYSRAVYWKNGKAFSLSAGDPFSHATAIAVVGKDIHVVGGEQIEGTTKAAYWKNGVVQYLGNGTLTGIAVVDNDVHIIGESNQYWKNGQRVDLPDCGYVGAITTAGHDVYITGRDNKYMYSSCVYWKNGEKVFLGSSAVGLCIAVSGDDVHVVGSSNVVGVGDVYWKNGEEKASLPEFFNTNALAVSGDDVYIVGQRAANRYASYWKNGVMTTLCDTKENSDATSIAVVGNDVFIVGKEYVNNMDRVRLWKNGQIIELEGYGGGETKHSYATSIVVIRK